jgi:hypothetical protein
MQFREASPFWIINHPDFPAAVAELRANELSVFDDGPASFDSAAYDKAWTDLLIDVYVVQDGDRMRGFAAIRRVPPVRRADKTYQVDVMWVADKAATRLMWSNILKIYGDCPLIAVAPVGSTYDHNLARHASHTHNTYVFEPRRTCDAPAEADAEALPAV